QFLHQKLAHLRRRQRHIPAAEKSLQLPIGHRQVLNNVETDTVPSPHRPPPPSPAAPAPPSPTSAPSSNPPTDPYPRVLPRAGHLAPSAHTPRPQPRMGTPGGVLKERIPLQSHSGARSSPETTPPHAPTHRLGTHSPSSA